MGDISNRPTTTLTAETSALPLKKTQTNNDQNTLEIEYATRKATMENEIDVWGARPPRAPPAWVGLGLTPDPTEFEYP